MRLQKAVWVFSAVALSVGSTACSMRKEMKEMHDSTQQMNETTRDMNNTTKELQKSTDQMSDRVDELAKSTQTMLASVEQMVQFTQNLNVQMESMVGMMSQMTANTKAMLKTSRVLQKQTAEMGQLTRTLDQTAKNTYRDLRQGEAAKLRNENLERLYRAETLEAKFAEAGKYLVSYEFQLWTGDGYDTEERRQGLYREAVMEFMRVVNDTMQRDVLPFIDHSDEPMPIFHREQFNNLYAIAASLDEINPSQMELLKKKKVSRVSMLSLIESALRAKLKLERGEIQELEPYQHEILVYEKQARFLIQARANFLPSIFLAMTSDVNVRGVKKYVAQADAFLFNWTPRVEQLNSSELVELNRAFTESLRAISILNETSGGSTRRVMSKPLLQIFRNMRDVSKHSVVGLGGKELAATQKKNKLLEQIQSKISQLRQMK